MNLTTNQQKILDLFKYSDILTAKEICKKITKIDRATVYRNLSKLVNEKRLNELKLEKNQISYELAHNLTHQHQICKICGDIKHFNIKKEDILKLLPDQDFEVENIELTITGRCKK